MELTLSIHEVWRLILTWKLFQKMGLKNPLLRFFAPPDNGFHKKEKKTNQECGENVDFLPSEIEDKMEKTTAN